MEAKLFECSCEREVTADTEESAQHMLCQGIPVLDNYGPTIQRPVKMSTEERRLEETSIRSFVWWLVVWWWL